MSERFEEITITVRVPADALAAEAVTAEDVAQAAQFAADEMTAAFRARKAAAKRNVTLGGGLTGVQVGDNNTQANTYYGR